MSKKNADSLLADLRTKISRGESLTRSDLAVLPLLPLYGGESSQQERIRAAFEISAKADNVSRPDIERIEAAVYASKETPPHIRSAEGRAEERKNTERERQRAEIAETNARKAEANARRAEAELQKLKKQLGLA